MADVAPPRRVLRVGREQCAGREGGGKAVVGDSGRNQRIGRIAQFKAAAGQRCRVHGLAKLRRHRRPGSNAPVAAFGGVTATTMGAVASVRRRKAPSSCRGGVNWA